MKRLFLSVVMVAVAAFAQQTHGSLTVTTTDLDPSVGRTMGLPMVPNVELFEVFLSTTRADVTKYRVTINTTESLEDGTSVAGTQTMDLERDNVFPLSMALFRLTLNVKVTSVTVDEMVETQSFTVTHP